MRTLPPEFVLKLPLNQNPLSAADAAEIPTINITDLDGSPACRASAVKIIGAACTDWRVFRVLSQEKVELMEEMMAIANDFFDLGSSEKMKYASEDVMSPVRYGTSLNTPEKHDCTYWRDYLRHYGYPFHNSLHLWPRNPSNYRKVCKKYLEHVWQLAVKIIGAISESLGLPHDYIEKSLGEASQILAINYYPPCPEPNRTLGLATHSDHGCITVLIDNGVDGLQVKHHDSWIAVCHVPASFIILVGDYLEILSNGRYKSVLHRATVNGEKTRISIAVGHGPGFSTIIGPASPILAQGEAPLFKPITYGDYVNHQQRTPLRGKTSLESLRLISD